MPGPVSDSYDPEFSTSENADAVRDAIKKQRDRLSKVLGPQLLPILDIVDDSFEHTLPLKFRRTVTFSERDLRIIRFALNRAIETV